MGLAAAWHSRQEWPLQWGAGALLAQPPPQLLLVGLFLAWSTELGILRLFFSLSLKSLS